jgi:hypothetical protein
MRKILAGLCLLMTLAISLLAVPVYANESATFQRAVTLSKYDVTKEVTVEGTVQSLIKRSAPGTMLGAHLMVSTARGEVDAHIGNYIAEGRFATPFASGQAVKLTGVMIEVNHQNVFVVRTLETDGRTITVRNERGFLVYPGNKTRLTGVSSTGGAR